MAIKLINIYKITYILEFEVYGMAINKALEMAGNMFNYENPCCDCKVTTNYTEDGVEVHSIQLKTTDNFYKYAYAPIDGLVMIDNKTGSIIEKNKVIEDFLNIDLSNANKIKEFIDTYGFFMPLPVDGKYRIFDHVELGNLLYRYKILVHLMSAIEEDSIDYDRVLSLTTYLLFAYPRRVALNENDEGICSCIHAFTDMWYKIDDLANLDGNMIHSYNDDPYDNYYPIQDSFTGKEEKLGMIDYHEDVDEVDTYNSSSDRIFKAKITKMYRDGFVEDMNINARYVIDYFYNLLKIGIKIDDINENGKIKKSEKLNGYAKFDEHFKSQLIHIAKITIKEEFDFELYGIHPTYNIENMSPSWEIPNFFTALYFALFYTRPDYEIYRKCANPNCNRLFKVKTTNSRKQYHDTACQNATAQMRHRKAKK